MRLACALPALLAALLAAPAAALLEDALEVLNLAREVGASVFSGWEMLQEIEGQESPLTSRDKRLLRQLVALDRRLERLEDAGQASSAAALSTVLARLPSATRLELRLNELADLLARVSLAARGMAAYAEGGAERHTLEDFAAWCVSHDPGAVPGLLQRVHLLLVPDADGLLGRGILELLLKSFEEADARLCNLQQSPQQLLHSMYTTVALTELKGYSMVQFSLMLLRVYGKGNFSLEADVARERFQQRSQELLAAVKVAMSQASRELWRCDPQVHVEGETFVALTRLLQGYIENEVDMNSEQTCRENCAYYSYAENHGCFKDMYCSRQRACQGKILNCQYVDSDMWVCPAARSSDRRYEWVEYENGRTLGRKDSCTRGVSKVDSWWRWLFWHCSYCLCLCDEAGARSDRHFSLRAALAATADNKVVTGLRFVKKDRVIHLQIAEGVLQPLGKIDQASVRWRAVEPLDLRSAQRGRDYHELSYEQRAVDLDDLEGPVGSLLTGVRFRSLGAHLNLEIRVTPFNFTSGRLIEPDSRSTWHSNDNTDASKEPRTRLSLYKPDVPTRTLLPSAPDSNHDQFVEFTHSDFDADAAQSTVPFLDAQAVAPLVSVPLTGAGLLHKGRPQYGGFLTPKLFTYDYTPHMHISQLEAEPALQTVPAA